MKVLWAIDVDVEVEVSHYYPGRHSKISGPPEGCYEAEPEEVDISAVYVAGCDVSAALSNDAWQIITEATLEKIKAQREADEENWYATRFENDRL